MFPVIVAIAAATLAAAAGWLALDNNAQAQTDLPAPENVQVVNGDNAGEVVVSWDAVAGASGYSVQWLDNDAALDAYYVGQDWRKFILSVDVEGGETTTHVLTVSNPTTGVAKYHFRVGGKGGPDAQPANFSDWQELDVRGDADQDVQALAAAIRISRLAGQLVALSGPTTPAMTPDGLSQSAAAVAGHRTDLAAQLEILAGTGYDARTGEIERLVNELGDNADLIQQGRGPLLRELLLGIGNRASVTIESTIDIVPAAETTLDDEFYGLVTGGNDGGSADSGDLSTDDLLRYSHLKNLTTTLDLATPTLFGASTQDNPALAGQLHELFDGRAASAARDLEYLRDLDDPELVDVLNLIEAMFNRGRGKDNLWDGLYRRLGLITQERVLVAKVANTQQLLLGEINGLVADVQGDPQPSTMPEVAAVGEPGVTDTEIKFGQSAVLKGPTAALGEGMKLGVEAAFNEVNQAGGISGRQLTLKTVNDHYEPFFAFTATSGLVNKDRVFGMIGAVGTPTTRAALPSVEAGHVPFVGAFTGAQLIRRDDQTYVLNVRASYHDEAEKMVESLVDMGKTKVAVLYQNDSFGHDGLIGVENALEKRGMETVASWYYVRNTSAVKSAAYRIANAEPDAVIIIGSYAPTAEFIRYARLRLMDDPIFMAVSFVSSDALKGRLVELRESLADVYVTEVVPSPTDESNQLVAEYQAALSAYNPQAEPGFISLEGYIAGRLAISRLQECGPDVTRECFLDVFDETTPIDISGLELEFGPMDNQGSDHVLLTPIEPEG